MFVPPAESWTSRATMPLVSVTMAWASETPGVRTPPTVVNAPYFRTCLRLSGLAMSSLPGIRRFSLENERSGFYSSSNRPMKLRGFVSKAMTLRQAAAVIFVLVAVLPLMLFVAFLSVSDLINKTEAQFAALMAVIIACLGFVVFRRLVDQIARLAKEVNLPILRDEPLAGATELSRVPALGQVAEIGQLAGAFHQMLEDLRAAAQRPGGG